MKVIEIEKTRMKRTFDICDYLANLPSDSKDIDVSGKNLTFLPDLSRFTHLNTLNCSHNNLTVLPELPSHLVSFDCSRNYLTTLPELPESVVVLFCFHNNLTRLPILTKNIKYLHCYKNDLICLPELPEGLIGLDCSHNKLTSLPLMYMKLVMIIFNSNPIFDTLIEQYKNTIHETYFRWNYNGNFMSFRQYVSSSDYTSELSFLKENIRVIHNFRYLFYTLKYKTKLRDLLWEKIRRPKIEKKYHPSNLQNILNTMSEEDDLIEILDHWEYVENKRWEYVENKR